MDTVRHVSGHILEGIKQSDGRETSTQQRNGAFDDAKSLTCGDIFMLSTMSHIFSHIFSSSGNDTNSIDASPKSVYGFSIKLSRDFCSAMARGLTVEPHKRGLVGYFLLL